MSVRDESDPNRLRRSEENVGKEFGNAAASLERVSMTLGLYTSEKRRRGNMDARGTSEVDRRAVLDRVLVAPARLGQLLLEELVSSKLGATLEEVADRSRAESGGETADALPVNVQAARGQLLSTLEASASTGRV